jgi:hypothetical protein
MLLFWATTPPGLVDEYLRFRKKNTLSVSSCIGINNIFFIYQLSFLLARILQFQFQFRASHRCALALSWISSVVVTVKLYFDRTKFVINFVCPFTATVTATTPWYVKWIVTQSVVYTCNVGYVMGLYNVSRCITLYHVLHSLITMEVTW